jgi:hypothetical protein
MTIYNIYKSNAIESAISEMPDDGKHYYIVCYDIGTKGVPYAYHTWYHPKAKLIEATSQKQAKELFKEWYGYVKGEKKYPFHIEARKVR